MSVTADSPSGCSRPFKARRIFTRVVHLHQESHGFVGLVESIAALAVIRKQLIAAKTLRHESGILGDPPRLDRVASTVCSTNPVL